ncbi:peptidoglycan-binding domain-containing protein [Roseibium sp.]|uniref:peptidoglycan-binding domain-containing protein n=1 Tax=Roseibium sp. TaxID=1936156 RepID=UPI003BA9659D
MRQFVRSFFVLISLFLTVGANAQTLQEIREAQTLLIRADRNPGPVDGAWGRRTEAALVDFLAERGLEFEGALTNEHLNLLRKAPEGPEFVRRAIGLRNTLPRILRDNRDQPENEPVNVTAGRELAEWADPSPNLVTLRFYLSKYLNNIYNFQHFVAEPSENPRSIAFKVTPNRYLSAQMNYTAMTSYLFYKDGAVIHDERSPESRFGDKVTDETGLWSNSVGKSMVSYLLAHAICEGHIGGVDTRLDDWPLIEDTVYDNQRIRDIADMRAGDQKLVDNWKGLISSGRWYNTTSIGDFARNELRGTKPAGQEGKRPHNYSGLPTNILLNYVIHKLGDDFENFMNRVFGDHVGVENRVLFFRNSGIKVEEGLGWYQFRASRYDYLRIAMTMLEDWESGNCQGQYFRDILARAAPKNRTGRVRYVSIDESLRYAGQFHAVYRGMENRNVLGMDGYGGQLILMDFDNASAIVVNSIHLDYDYYQLVHRAIQNGKLP